MSGFFFNFSRLIKTGRDTTNTSHVWVSAISRSLESWEYSLTKGCSIKSLMCFWFQRPNPMYLYCYTFIPSAVLGCSPDHLLATSSDALSKHRIWCQEFFKHSQGHCFKHLNTRLLNDTSTIRYRLNLVIRISKIKKP